MNHGPSEKLNFWNHNTFLLIGHSGRMGFPKLTLQALRSRNKTVIVIDSAPKVLDATVAGAEVAILEAPNDEGVAWIRHLADRGVKRVWFHMDTETPEALDLSRKVGMEVHTGSCALMYLSPKTFPHNVHAWIERLRGKY